MGTPNSALTRCGVPLDPWTPIPPEVSERLAARYPDAVGLRRIFMLAPRLSVALALLAGESVPADVLDPLWMRRLGRRP